MSPAASRSSRGRSHRLAWYEKSEAGRAQDIFERIFIDLLSIVFLRLLETFNKKIPAKVLVKTSAHIGLQIIPTINKINTIETSVTPAE